ncbi:putative methylaconitate Delta-isomerase PrpF [Caldovatus sediminis]|uniref:Putative methylaconitate Delta-isomerase PrpF n=1 Tax=Caldovatus sediminis TaxID=2041189 RepID=A0A8J2ZBG7_9PROT|nr:PrpF domain-containing protein [Caldovatus sediminis]GGG31663.1 putative methylaconitate Delta-isomerase PrpF [Caldovatus sediminis]
MPNQRFIPAVFMRGGTSKGVFFHARDLPAERAAQERIFLGVLGSPDPYGRQLDGMGGGISSLSKAVIIGPPTHPEADLDYTFAQVAVDRPAVDWAGNCGNLSSAVGPFAVDEGLVRAPRQGEALVRIHQTNTRKLIHARFPVRDGRAEVRGDFAIAGVPGTGARVRLDFLAPGGAASGALLPTGRVLDALVDEGRRYRASLVDASTPVVFVEAEALGLTGAETPEEIEARPGVMARLDRLRRVGAVAMGLAASPEKAGLGVPKVAMVAAPAAYRTIGGETIGAEAYDIAVRAVSMERLHRAVPLTAALCLGVACRIEGTLPNLLARRGAGAAEEVRIGNPSGVLAAGAEVRRGADGAWVAESALMFRTARRLMQGEVAWLPPE